MNYATNNKTVTKKLDNVTLNVVKYLLENRLTVSFAESCTGGLIAKCITDVPGSSSVFELGVVSYSNRVKAKILGVSEQTLSEFSEVSEQTAKQMCQGVLNLSNSDFAVSTTGIAGPSGGSESKPVGTVYVCVSSKQGCENYVCRNLELNKNPDCASREDIRLYTALEALQMLYEFMKDLRR